MSRTNSNVSQTTKETNGELNINALDPTELMQHLDTLDLVPLPAPTTKELDLKLQQKTSERRLIRGNRRMSISEGMVRSPQKTTVTMAEMLRQIQTEKNSAAKIPVALAARAVVQEVSAPAAFNALLAEEQMRRAHLLRMSEHLGNVSFVTLNICMLATHFCTACGFRLRSLHMCLMNIHTAQHCRTHLGTVALD